jgi:hypothetical protein
VLLIGLFRPVKAAPIAILKASNPIPPETMPTTAAEDIPSHPPIPFPSSFSFNFGQSVSRPSETPTVLVRISLFELPNSSVVEYLSSWLNFAVYHRE